MLGLSKVSFDDMKRIVQWIKEKSKKGNYTREEFEQIRYVSIRLCTNGENMYERKSPAIIVDIRLAYSQYTTEKRQ